MSKSHNIFLKFSIYNWIFGICSEEVVFPSVADSIEFACSGVETYSSLSSNKTIQFEQCHNIWQTHFLSAFMNKNVIKHG